ncbi:MAG: hypothetical protein QXN05_00455 [Acidilobaceae archaeon]
MTVRVICWTRGDPEFIAVVRKMKSLLEIQGLSLVLTSDVSTLSCHAIVCCGCNSEKEVCHSDPWVSLFKALSPSGRFRSLRIGVDPGSFCSLAAYADNLLIWLEKGECEEIAKRIKWLTSIAPSDVITINVGSGSGWERVAIELTKLELSFRLVEESRTSSRPIYSKLKDKIKDEDLLAAMTISLSL